MTTEEKIEAEKVWRGERMLAAHTDVTGGVEKLEEIRARLGPNVEVEQAIFRLKEGLGWIMRIGHDGRRAE